MDNTLKILLGVLSVTGFITVVIPQGNPVAPRAAARTNSTATISAACSIRFWGFCWIYNRCAID